MHTIYKAIRAVLAWLNEPQGGNEDEFVVPCWADLPSYHPRDTAP
jgi:hypothetical protein